MSAIESFLQPVAAVLLVPPVNLALLAFVAVLLRRRWLAAVSLALLVLCALPVVSGTLLAGLEDGVDVARPGIPPPAAIVILGGDVTELAPPSDPDEAVEADDLDIGVLTLQRLRGGAALSRATHLPVLVTGGVVVPDDPPVAVLMARSLRDDFAVTPRWIEPKSRDTWENARFSAALLRRDGIRSVYLVTHAWHMRRALIAFAAAGIDVVPAPLPRDRVPDASAGNFVPRVSSWGRSYYALHEWIGCAWYAWGRGRPAG